MAINNDVDILNPSFKKFHHLLYVDICYDFISTIMYSSFSRLTYLLSLILSDTLLFLLLGHFVLLSEASRMHMVQIHDFGLTVEPLKDQVCSVPQELVLYSPMEECALGPACWLWDYLRRSGANDLNA